MAPNDDTTRTRRDEASDTLVDGSGPPAGFSGDRIGRYEVLAELGRGGMGVVYRARDPELDRPLAIKVVVPIGGRSRSKQKLLDEARAMAKLRHPAVVPVFDVGTTDDGIYIVMPLLAGGTMAEWARKQPPWREVVARYMTAGRGLAAAHSAGLVHRDFKPRNVLVGDAGEVVVADFGLAATLDSDDGSVPPRTSPEATSGAGTPAYMAPEQAAGQAVDARADQYSFCISVWEALHGQRPGDAATRSGTVLPSAVVPTVPTDRKGAPGWLLAAVARGFSTTPSLRWPSMTALLEHIEGRLRRPRRLAFIAGALAMVGAAAAAVFVLPAKAESPCPDPRARVAAAWSPEIRNRVEMAFAATNLPFAADTFEHLAPVLDSYAASWRAKHIEVCRAGRVDHTQSGELLDRRMACFEHNLATLTAFSKLLAEADPTVVRRAIQGAAQLPAVEGCVDAKLVGAIPLPSSKAERERLNDLGQRIAVSRVERLRGTGASHVETSARLAAEARDVGYPPLLVIALDNEADARRENRVPNETVLRELVDVAAAAHDDASMAGAWAGLIHELARQGKLAEAAGLEAAARAAVTRAGSPRGLNGTLESALGQLKLAQGDARGAEASYRVVLEAAEGPLPRVIALTQLANSLVMTKRMSEARPIIEEALAQAATLYGTQHADYARILQMQSQILRGSGDADDLPQARAALEHALEIMRASYGEEHIDVASVLFALAELEFAVGRNAEAEGYARRAVQINDKLPDDLRRGSYLQRLGSAIAKQGRAAEAMPYFEQALAHAEKVYGKDKLPYAGPEVNFANRLLELNDHAGARARAAHAAAVFEANEVLPGQAIAMRIIAQCDLHEGKVDAFVTAMERVIEICSQPGCSPGNLEAFEQELGEQLVVKRIDRARGLQLVKKARAGASKLGRDADVKEMDAWLKKHEPAGK